MTSITHGSPVPARTRLDLLRMPAWKPMWASLAIVAMWMAVLFDAVFGPDLVSNGGGLAGGGTTVPSAIVVAFFAFLATIPVARYGFGGSDAERD